MKKFLEAHNHTYHTALSEVKLGKKTSHWMWYIFPQINGLGQSDIAKYYAIADLDEASAYLEHPILGVHLIEIFNALAAHHSLTAAQIFGAPDDLKLRSCMTLFANVKNTNKVFNEVLNKYFNGIPDGRTLAVLEDQS